MNAVLAGPPSTIVHSPYLGSISAGGLATITVSAVLSGVRNLSQNMPTGCAPITLVRTTTERQAIWPMSPAADPQPARGFDFYDATV
jgi:hypothetical protein